MTQRPAVGVTGCFAVCFVKPNAFGKRWGAAHDAEVLRVGAPFVNRSLTEGAMSNEIIFTNYFVQGGREAEHEIRRKFKLNVPGRIIITDAGNITEPLTATTDVPAFFDIVLKIRTHERAGTWTCAQAQELVNGYPTMFFHSLRGASA